MLPSLNIDSFRLHFSTTDLQASDVLEFHVHQAAKFIMEADPEDYG